MNIKRILFYVCLVTIIISVSSVMTMTTVITAAAAVCCLFYLTSEMTTEDIYKISGAYWFNKIFNTTSFTEE